MNPLVVALLLTRATTCTMSTTDLGTEKPGDMKGQGGSSRSSRNLVPLKDPGASEWRCGVVMGRNDARVRQRGDVLNAGCGPRCIHNSWKSLCWEAAGPEIPEGDREARLLRSRHAGGVPSVEAAGPEPLWQQIHNLLLVHDFAA
jgi:hypothetical protein